MNDDFVYRVKLVVGVIFFYCCYLQSAVEAPDLYYESVKSSVTELQNEECFGAKVVKVPYFFEMPSNKVSMQFSPDGNKLAIVSDKGVQIVCFDIGYSFKIMVPTESVGFSPDGELVVFGTCDGKVLLFDSNKSIFKALYAYEVGAHIAVIKFSPNTARNEFGLVGLVASASTLGEIKIFNLATAQTQSICSLKNVSQLAFDKSATMLALGMSEGDVYLLDLCSFEYIYWGKCNNNRGVCALSFDPMYSFLRIGSINGDVVISNLENNSVIDEQPMVLGQANPAAVGSTNFSDNFCDVIRKIGDNQIKVVCLQNIFQSSEFHLNNKTKISNPVLSCDGKKLAFIFETDGQCFVEVLAEYHPY